MSDEDKNAERDKKIIDVTFNQGSHPVTGWGWKIPNKPGRIPGQASEEEMEAYTKYINKTPQVREATRTKTYTYWAPFNYPNAVMELGRPGTGVEVNYNGAELDIYPYGSITIEEEEPIVAVTVIGSGCSGDGYLVLEAEPVVWKYPQTAVRMMKKDLWGIHMRYNTWKLVGEDWNDCGLSCARFDIPESKKIIVGGGSHGADPHYCIRLIRIEVQEKL